MTAEASMKSNKDRLFENLYRPIKYLRKELESSIEVIRVRNTAAQGFFKTLQTITQEKEKLISYDTLKNVEVDPVAHELAIDLFELKRNSPTDASDKTLLLYLMFPSKRRQVQEMRKCLGFFNQQFQQEIAGLGQSLVAKLTDAQASLCSEMKEIHKIEVGFWDSALNRAIDAMGHAETK